MIQDTKILIVEDDIFIAQDIQNTVIEFGYKVTKIVSNENDVLKSIKLDEPNVILMDIDLNHSSNGIEIVKTIHKLTYIPVIYLTGLYSDEIIDKAIQTKPIGFLTKPFNSVELKSAIKLALNHNEYNKTLTHIGFNYYYDFNNCHIYYENQIIKLGRYELELLDLLVRAKGELVSFKTIENELWGNEPVTKDNIRNLISRLRKKLHPKIIETVYSYGFKITS